MKHFIASMGLAAALVAGRAFAQAEAEQDAWAGYLDFAYVYSSAELEALATRLRDYGRETHMSLPDYITRRLENASEGEDGEIDEVVTRRLAVAHLLQYLASGETDQLEASVSAARKLEGRLGRHENRYWC
jgi:ribose 1,5-bisphosphokinase PhnN